MPAIVGLGVATYALSGVPAIDTAACASLGALQTWGKWNEELLAEIGVALKAVGAARTPAVVALDSLETALPPAPLTASTV